MAYDIGDQIRCSVEFTNRSGTYVDPSSVTFKIKNPTGTITSYIYGTDDKLVKEATGKYYILIEPTSSGIWHYRFEGDGIVIAASESNFVVKATQF